MASNTVPSFQKVTYPTRRRQKSLGRIAPSDFLLAHANSTTRGPDLHFESVVPTSPTNRKHRTSPSFVSSFGLTAATQLRRATVHAWHDGKLDGTPIRNRFVQEGSLNLAAAPELLHANCDSAVKFRSRSVPPSNCVSGKLRRKSKELVGEMTRVNSRTFEKTASEQSVEGGTASFRALDLKEDQRGNKSKNHWIGKDLSHTPMEAQFYEDALALSKQSEKCGLEALLRFMLEYLGVHRVCTSDVDSGKPLEMLVLRNLFDGRVNERMVDIKMGQKPASADWFGKSRMKAYFQNTMADWTNSGREGFRLAAFNGAPPSHTSREPTSNLPVVDPKRVMLSQRTGSEIFASFFDEHQEPEDPGTDALAKQLSPSEMVEIVHHEVMTKFVSLAMACREVSVPQKWVGSSIGIDFDSGYLPSRDDPEADLRKAVRLFIFDFGRSELNTTERHASLSPEAQKNRHEYWSSYKGGVDWLLWEAIRSYLSRFGTAVSWGRICAKVYDFDYVTADDFLGEVEIDVEKALGQGKITVELKNSGRLSWTHPLPSTITYSVEQREYPHGSRLSSALRICFHEAQFLRAADPSGSSDPFVELCAASSKGMVQYQRSSVVMKSLSPKWNETFELPLTVEQGLDSLRDALDKAIPGLSRIVGYQNLWQLFPPLDCTDEQCELARAAFSKALDQFMLEKDSVD